jgi:hypothetical protein
VAEKELNQAIQLIKSGEKEAGKGILIGVVRNDPYNENAWLWLASVTDAEQRVYCLQKALAINPQNEQVRSYLSKLKSESSLYEAYAEKKPGKEVAWEPPQAEAYEFDDDEYEDEYEYDDEDDYEDEEIDFPDAIQEKYLQADGSWVFKPRRDGTLIYASLILIVILTAAFILYTFLGNEGMRWDMYLFFTSLPMLAMIYGFFAKFAGVYHIVIENAVLRGPKYERVPWIKEELQVQHIELHKTRTSYTFLRHAVVYSSKGSVVLIYGFDRETFNDLMTTIWVMQVKAANGLSEQLVSAKPNKKNTYENIKGDEQTMQYTLPKGEIVFKPNRRLVFLTRTLPGMLIFLPFLVYLQNSGFNDFADMWRFYIIFPLIILHYIYRVSPWFNITITETELSNGIPMLYGGYDRNSIKIKDIMLEETVKNWRGATFIRTGEWDHVEVRGYTQKDVAHILQIIKHRQSEAYQRWLQSKNQF